MKALRLHGPYDLRLNEEERPVPGHGESLVRVQAVGICGSDLHWLAQGGIGDARLSQPLILGHEFAGETNGGERIAVDPAVSCGVCLHCREGNPNFCEFLVFAGHGRQDGALREYIAWPTRCCHPLPDSLTAADGAMLEPLGVAIHAVDLAHLAPGMRVGVLGCGPIGLLVLQLARLAGAAGVYCADALPHRVDAARGLGATRVVLVEPDAVSVEAARMGGETGLDVVFEVAGRNAAVETAIEAVKPGGKVLLVGIPPDDSTTFCASTARRKGITLKLVRRMKHMYPRAIKLAAYGSVDVRSLVTHRFPLAEARAAFQAAEERTGIKVIVEIP